MTTHTTAVSPQRYARVAGILYLTIIATGIFAHFFVRASLIAPGDAATTAGNILAPESFFRAGIAADLVMILPDEVQFSGVEYTTALGK
ncbi:DUF4386 domain-containing protein [Caldilinea sp.]|uniref:DUF4386 domain-containing protein n=1 Tax=Caldilinea sp. TaxID=2293560 RepID=UPI002C18EB11|nr:DUF4386 domain-containing protein [Anaerolineales bacterium]HQY93997.1 DUF4386 domain-containing protein [Caldilinea sp.]HRA65439.1 DUF4386 domain-containing protein [Caldilinea sp.]